jgi:hypothetical protein
MEQTLILIGLATVFGWLLWTHPRQTLDTIGALIKGTLNLLIDTFALLLAWI